ncbi:hypothetical protein [Carboxylicivirga marina]|uniref:DUF1735 domain-containing protein n=1 Tax=Carboxylicivirga marina TaxID=2800988 RepID=A0ABS1HJI9_9BACT|nr:hypothetical protein [Carboxylicivirga marina]MBK3517796.1 hypothetical protein [Carboxylicivirga marina]
MVKNLYILKFILLLLVFYSCTGDLFNTDKLDGDIEITPGVAMPLMHAQVTMKDIFNDDTDYIRYYKDDNDFERIILYQKEDSVSNLTLDDLFEFSMEQQEVDVVYSELNRGSEFSIPINIPIITENGTLSAFEASYRMAISGEELTSPLYLKIELPTINAQDGGKIIETELSNSQSYEAFFENDFFELVDQNLPAILTFSSQDASRNYDLEIGKILFVVDELDYDYIKGTMTENSLRFESGSIEMNYDNLEKFPEGVEFDTPVVNLLITNSTPFIGIIDPYFKSEIAPEDSLELIFPNIVVPASPEGEYIQDTLVVDKNNSNIIDFMSYMPETIEYEADLLLNPGYALFDEVELTDESAVNLGYLVEVPTVFRANSGMAIDTLFMDDYEVLQDLVEGSMEVAGSSSFPFQTEMFIDIYDEEQDMILSTIRALLLEAAPVNSDGYHEKTIEQYNRVVLTSEHIEHLKMAEELRLRMHLTRSNYEDESQMVVLTTDQALDMSVNIKGVFDNPEL